MCNACGFLCCASDEFHGCGCDNCDEEECWTICDPINGIHSDYCDCPIDDFEEDDYDE